MTIDESENKDRISEDVVADKTQAAYLGMLLAMWDWFTARVAACDLFDAQINAERNRAGLKVGATPIDYLGKALWVTFILVVLSGIGLLVGYSPTVTGAFSSVENIQTSFPFGWWLRGVHKYGTDLFVILAILRVIRILYRRAYKAPGEFTWLVSIGILFLGIVAGVTGYLLVWHQRALWNGGALGIGSGSFDDALPFGGLGLFGNEITQSVLSQIFVIHIALGLLLMLVTLFWRIMSRSQVSRHRHFSPYPPGALTWTIIAVLTLIALMLPPPLGSTADGILKPHPILADWYCLAFYQLVEIISYPSAFLFFLTFILFAIFLPWIDRGRALGPRPIINALIIAGLLTWLILTVKSFGWTLTGVGVIVFLLLIWSVAIVIGFMPEWCQSKKIPGRRESEVIGE